MDYFTAALVIVFGAVAARMVARGLTPREQRFATVAFYLHVLASLMYWALYEFYYGFGDIFTYQAYGMGLAKLVDSDAPRFAVELAKLALHLDTNLPIEVRGAGSSTGTMCALAGAFIFVAGSSALSMCLITTWVSWFGQLCLYRVVREELGETERSSAMAGFLFVPSVVFWGSGFGKEAFVIGFFGMLCLSTYKLLRGRELLYSFGVVVGGGGVALIKPYTLFAYFLGLAGAVYVDRARRGGGTARIRPGYLILAVMIAVGGVAAMGALFPEFGADRVAETIAQRQTGVRGEEGGSNIEMGNEDADTGTRQLVFVPIALGNALFRPAIFEARNAPGLVAALEMTFLTFSLISLLGARRRGATARAVFGEPLLAFGVVFVLVFGTGVGLATGNLGTLSRYRVPMMPFYAATVLLLRRRGLVAVSVAQDARASVLLARRSSRSA